MQAFPLPAAINAVPARMALAESQHAVTMPPGSYMAGNMLSE